LVVSLGSRLFAFTIVVRTSVTQARTIVANLLGIGDEESVGEPIYGALGVVHRPLPPDDKAHAEAVAIRVGDSLIPMAWRDVRLDAVASDFAVGETGFVGYGGGSYRTGLTATPSGDQRATVHTIRAPYEFADGIASKEHVIRIDPTPGSETITVLHGDGHKVTLGPETILLENGDATAELSPTLFRVDAQTIELQAVAVKLGSNVAAAMPITGQLGQASASVHITTP
jgi:hypothetical protein